MEHIWRRTYHALSAVPWSRLLGCIFLSLSLWFVCISEHRARNFDAFWIYIVSIWLANKAMLSSYIGLGDGPESLPLQYSSYRHIRLE